MRAPEWRVQLAITDYYKSSEALKLITKALPDENSKLSLIDAIRMGPIRTWVFHRQGRLRLKFKPARILIPSDLWWNLSEDLTRVDLREYSVLRVDLATGRAHLLLVDGHCEYFSGELQIHKAGLTRWLNGLEQSDIGVADQEPLANRKKPAEQMHNRWIARAKELRAANKNMKVSEITRKIWREDARAIDLNTKGETREEETIRRVLYTRKSEWDIPQES